MPPKTLFITGASRGIGKAIALKAAVGGANVVIAARTAEPHATLPGTIYSAAADVEAAGGRALPLEVDIRSEDRVEAAVERAVEVFGGIDALVNNASAISLTGTLETPVRRFDLLFDVNVRGTFVCSRACVPHLRRSVNPHILVLAPPLDLDPRWFAPHLAYSLSKYGMSLCVLGMAEEFRADGIAVNALWPRTVIATAALRMLGGTVAPEECRTPEIVAEAAWAILGRDSRHCSGNFFLDEEVLAEEGVSDLERYAVQPGARLRSDVFVSPAAGDLEEPAH
ncbi:MAG TPA: NAD(P)-dependent oxidoreductase [Gemmatimonadota bacterium]|nr:NAD(P)-dependent oxidoreductase [Gemmatimonadota bacterium]